jgi:adenylate cyclase
MTSDQVKRKLAAILSADVQGYSRLMEEDEEGTIRTLKIYMEVITGFLQQHRGRLVATGGDSVLAEFASVVDAVRCAVGIQEELKERNKDVRENHRMEFRIGVNLGDVVEDGDNILGDGVNIAARVQSLADAGGICITGTAYDHVKNKLAFGYEYIGEQTVKNIKEPVMVYRVLMEPGIKIPDAAPSPLPEEKKPERKRLSRAVLAGIALVVIAAATALYMFVLRPSTPIIEVASKEKMAFPLPDNPSIAVLPFVNMSEDPKQEYLSDGITEEIITALSKIPQVFVIGRTSTFNYKGKSVRVKHVSEELGVRYVLEGSVRKKAEKIRISAQLIDATRGHPLWAERYDRDLKDIFALQDEITLRIVSALQVKLTVGEQARMTAKDTNNLEAYLKLMQVREAAGRITKEGNVLARKLAEEAISLDPSYAKAYLSLSATHLMDLFYGTTESPEKSLRRAQECVQKAISLDDSSAEAHAYLGRIYLTKRQYEKAIAEGEQAFALGPNSDFIQAALAFSLYYAGRFEEAMGFYKKAIRLSPIPPAWYLTGLGSCYREMGRYEEAITEYKKGIHRAPDNSLSYLGLTANYSLMGREKKARVAAGEVLRLDPKFSLEQYAKKSLFKNPSDLDRLITALRKAGLK